MRPRSSGLKYDHGNLLFRGKIDEIARDCRFGGVISGGVGSMAFATDPPRPPGPTPPAATAATAPASADAASTVAADKAAAADKAKRAATTAKTAT